MVIPTLVATKVMMTRDDLELMCETGMPWLSHRCLCFRASEP